MTVSTQELPAHSDQMWLTTLLRPAGLLAGAAMSRFVEELTRLAEYTNIVVVNLVAAVVPDPAAFAEALREPGELLSGSDRCLLLVGAKPDLLTELRQHGGEIAVVEEPASA